MLRLIDVLTRTPARRFAFTTAKGICLGAAMSQILTLKALGLPPVPWLLWAVVLCAASILLDYGVGWRRMAQQMAAVESAAEVYPAWTTRSREE